MPANDSVIPGLPASYTSTRRSLHALACFVIAPARLARTGRIGLRVTPGGFGTPAFDDGSLISVRDNQLLREPGGCLPITTLRSAARFVEVELIPDPGVGKDLPAFEPDRVLAVDVESSRALAYWYSRGTIALGGIRRRLGDTAAVGEAQIWPEHFDLAAEVSIDGRGATVGFSPGDSFCNEPYAYVAPTSPHPPATFWNAPFGAFRRAREVSAPLEFITAALQLLQTPAPVPRDDSPVGGDGTRR
jgi:hypothetical protein